MGVEEKNCHMAKAMFSVDGRQNPGDPKYRISKAYESVQRYWFKSFARLRQRSTITVVPKNKLRGGLIVVVSRRGGATPHALPSSDIPTKSKERTHI